MLRQKKKSEKLLYIDQDCAYISRHRGLYVKLVVCLKLRLLASDGMLVKRPLLVTDERVFTGFKEAEWSEAF